MSLEIMSLENMSLENMSLENNGGLLLAGKLAVNRLIQCASGSQASYKQCSAVQFSPAVQSCVDM